MQNFMNFDQILTKFVKIFIIYVKNYQMHVKKKQEYHVLHFFFFLINVKNHPGFGGGALGYIWGGGILG